MSPVIHCIRHGQGFHNIGAGCYTLPDPHLTPLGEEQCKTLRKTAFSDQSKISLVLASPLCRTLQSAHLVFQPALTTSSKCHPEIIAIPDAQETSDDPCDIGTDPSVLRRVVNENKWPVDLSLVEDGWNVKALGTRYSPESHAIAARARDARILIRQKIRQLIEQGDADPQVALVTHGSFLHYFTGDWEDSWLKPATGWQNCETRTYTFKHDLMDDMDLEARLNETMESRLRRGKTDPMPAEEEQSALFEQAMDNWEKQGLQRPDRIGLDHKAGVLA
ncbi:phosphoglycerate mutase family protein [Colletotrichum truncatum]|uniref:Phosphoglycerate mutase family protein n=1 Tax=Colletotrichum truncatum TaxID=5467 RepID=A0ACC3YRD8_COLTU|nr:phosphoglycerate mutase family protein [Colletotrichum truncatum]KAF6784177.1 phosphoglycerate mutase family protein [Colletotrichum truncatum]